MHEPRRRVVAAFDFDGTLTRSDTLLPFLRFLCGPRALALSLLRHAGPLSVAVPLDRQASRASVKERVLRGLLEGRCHEDVRAAGERFACRLHQGARLRPGLVSRWHWHREHGHDIVIVSASLAAYIEPFARDMGGATVLATRLLVDDNGTLTGEFEGFNCRGVEKVRRLRAWGWSPDTETWAYGDSSGDHELLTAAHVGHRISRGGHMHALLPS